MNEKEIFGLIDERREELFQLLSEMVKINSESFGSYGNEQNMAEYVHKLCLDLGLESEMYSPLEIENFENHPDYMPGRNLENRFNVYLQYTEPLLEYYKNKKILYIVDGNQDVMKIHNYIVRILEGEIW